MVRALVDNVKARWAVSANTYVGHAGGEENSVDFWGLGGRGDPIEKAVGSAIHAHLIQTYPAINWIIWDGIYTGPDGTYPDPSGWGHYDHVHVTIGSSDSEGKTIERTLSSR